VPSGDRLLKFHQNAKEGMWLRKEKHRKSKKKKQNERKKRKERERKKNIRKKP